MRKVAFASVAWFGAGIVLGGVTANNMGSPVFTILLGVSLMAAAFAVTFLFTAPVIEERTSAE